MAKVLKDKIWLITIVTIFGSILGKVKLLNERIFASISNDVFFYGILFLFLGFIWFRKKRDGVILEELSKAVIFLKSQEFSNSESHYNSIYDEFYNDKKYKELVKIWRLYNSSIIKIEDKGLTSFCQMTDSEEFYNNDVLLKERMNSKILNYVPQLMVGLGLLGTFLGLSMGLSGLDLKDSTDINQVNQLLDGVKTSFYTSLYGMYFSIIFTVIINLHIGDIEKRILELKDNLNLIFHRNNGSEIVQDIKKEIEQIRVSNEGMASAITNGISQEMNKNREASDLAMKEISELLGAKIGGISQVLSGSFEKTIGDSLEKVFSKDFIEKFENIKNQLIDVSEKNNKFIIEYKNEIKEIAYTTGDLKDSYVELTQKMVEDFNEVKNQLDKKFSQFNIIFESSSQMYKELNEFYKKNSFILDESNKMIAKFENVSIKLSDFIDIQNTTTRLWESYKDSFDRINNSISQNMKSYDELMRYELNEYQKVISESSNLYNQVISKSSETYGELIDKRTLEYTRNINEGITQLFNEYEENLVSVIDKFNGTLKLFKEDLNKMGEILGNTVKLSDTNRVISEENSKNIKQLEMLNQKSSISRSERNINNNEIKGE